MEHNFFPDDAIGGRGSKEHAASTVVIDAAGELIETDIPISSSVRLSPRKSFCQWMRAQQAAQGGKARLYPVSERDCRLEYLG